MLRRRASPSIALRENSQYLVFKVEEAVMIMSLPKIGMRDGDSPAPVVPPARLDDKTAGD